MVKDNSSKDIESKDKNKDPFDEIVEILQDYDSGFDRDSKTDYEF